MPLLYQLCLPHGQKFIVKLVAPHPWGQVPVVKDHDSICVRLTPLLVTLLSSTGKMAKALETFSVVRACKFAWHACYNFTAVG